MEITDDPIKHIIKSYETNGIPFGAIYIIPDGRLLDLTTIEQGHAGISEYLNEQGIEKNYVCGTASKLLKELGWIRANSKLKYVDLVDISPTDKQYESLAKVLDYMKDNIQIKFTNKFELYNGRTTNEIISLIKDLSDI